MKKMISLALMMVCMIGISSCSNASKSSDAAGSSASSSEEYPAKKSLKPADESITYNDDWGSYDVPIDIDGLYAIESMELDYRSHMKDPLTGSLILVANGKPREELTGYAHTASGEVQILDKNGEVIYSRELDSNNLKDIIQTEPGNKVKIYEPFARISSDEARKILKNSETVRIVDLGIANHK
ncbi:MAG: hypothetical protein K2L81_02640 [Muribaculaceae bacterium]|nr:hypothetical protein [Muribaculaceae bacterium]